MCQSPGLSRAPGDGEESVGGHELLRTQGNPRSFWLTVGTKDGRERILSSRQVPGAALRARCTLTHAVLAGTV